VKRTAMAIAALALVVGLALAQPGAGCPMAQAGGNSPQMMKVQKIEQAAMPAMTAEQLDKIDALKVKHLKEVLPMQTDLQVKEMELGALWRADKLDAGKILAKVKEVNDARGKLELVRVNHQIDMYNLMTPEQRKAMRPGMMGPGGRRGMMRGYGMGQRMGRGMGRGMMRGMNPGGQCQMGQCDPGSCGDCGMQ
jgi:Spy/CpxP family protein refolding chaperone